MNIRDARNRERSRVRITLKLAYTMKEITEASRRGLSPASYRPLRSAGVSHEIVLEVISWLEEYQLPLATWNSVARALLVMNRLKMDYHELKRFVVFRSDRLRDLARLICCTESIEESYAVMLRGIPLPTYLKTRSKAGLHDTES